MEKPDARFTLAHPSLADGPTGEEAHVAAFPEIRLNWTAFCLPTIHAWGVRRSEHEVNPLQFSMAYWHEMMHWNLAPAPLEQGMRSLTHLLWEQIDEASHRPDVNHEPLPVPLNPRPEGHSMERLWHGIVTLAARSQVVHEVFAVWGSISQTKKYGDFTEGVLKRAERALVRRYDTAYGGFRAAYTRFKRVADHVDYEVARALVYGPIHSRDSGTALMEMLDRSEPILRGREQVDTMQLLELYVELRPRAFADLAQALGDLELDLGDPYSGMTAAAPFMCTYDARGLYFPSEEWMRDARQYVLGHAEWQLEHQRERAEQIFALSESLPQFMWYESLRQQVTQGAGYQCPFWNGESCCGLQGELRTLASSVRSVARPGRWEPRGCLKS